MLRSILVAIDDTPGALAARSAAIGLAARTGAALTCAAVLDHPHTLGAVEPMPPGGIAFAERRNATLAARAATEAETAVAAAVAAAGAVPVASVILPDAPEPALLRAGATHDLIVLGRDCTLGREETDNGLAPCAEALIRDGGRPLLLVPPGSPDHAAEDPVLVAYDGSMPAMRAIQLFALLGLAEQSPVKVISAHADAAEARRLVAEGAGYLRRHGLSVEEWPLGGSHAADLLLAEATTSHARLLVMGAFGRTGLRAMFLGTATRRLLREAPCTVFVQH